MRDEFRTCRLADAASIKTCHNIVFRTQWDSVDRGIFFELVRLKGVVVVMRHYVPIATSRIFQMSSKQIIKGSINLG